jgi:SUR7/PalI family
VLSLILVSVSVPVDKSFYFLQAQFSASVNTLTLAGTATLGMWGYCIDTSGVPSQFGGNSLRCSNATLGYQIDANALFGVNVSSFINIPNSVVKPLTYVLILHPIGERPFSFLNTLQVLD